MKAENPDSTDSPKDKKPARAVQLTSKVSLKNLLPA
jgi:hypothetical protein